MDNESNTGKLVLGTAVALKVAKAACLYGVKLGGEVGSRRPYVGAAIAGGSALLLKVFVAAAVIENGPTFKEYMQPTRPK